MDKNNGQNEFWVRLKYNKEIGAVEAVFVIGAAALLLGSFVRKDLRTPATVFIIIAIVLQLVYSVIMSLKEYDDEVIRRNKILNIVFSVRKTVFDYLFWIYFITIEVIITINNDISWTAVTFIVVFAMILVLIMPDKISKYFKNKIIK